MLFRRWASAYTWRIHNPHPLLQSGVRPCGRSEPEEDEMALYGAYYTKEDEREPVFHVYEDCSEGEKIEPENRIYVIPGRRICKVCSGESS